MRRDRRRSRVTSHGNAAEDICQDNVRRAHAARVTAARRTPLRRTRGYLVRGKPRSTFEVPGSGQREVTTLARV